MIKANKNELIERFFSIYTRSALRKHFNSIQICGEENFLNRSSNPAIIYSNHSNWWDGLIAFYLSRSRWNIDAYLMMDEEQMNKYAFFRWIGAFSVNRSIPNEAMESINYAVSLLKNKNAVLWIYPQGLMQPNDYRPIKFFSGVSRIIEKMDGVELIPMTLRYEFLLEQRPDVFVQIGKVKFFQKPEEIRELTAELQTQLVSDLELLKARVISGTLDGFKVILQGKSSTNKAIDKLH
jgi:1-acyl-sn-glycerol-3-phosphate acyltransferase